MDRQSFIFYESYYNMGLKIKNKVDRCDFYEGIMTSALKGIDLPETDDPLIDMAYTAIKPLIQASVRNYENGCKGGAPSKSMKGNQNAKKQTQNKPKTNRGINPKQTENKGNYNYNDNDNKDLNKDFNVNDNDNENVNVNVNVNNNSAPPPLKVGAAIEDEVGEPWPDDFWDN